MLLLYLELFFFIRNNTSYKCDRYESGKQLRRIFIKKYRNL